jgi:hypothetical protein
LSLATIRSTHRPSIAATAGKSDRCRAAVELAGDVGPHLCCCGHVHSAWAFVPDRISDQLAGTQVSLFRDRTGTGGFLEIPMDDQEIVVNHHAWTEESWQSIPLHRARSFFWRPGSTGWLDRGCPVVF